MFIRRGTALPADRVLSPLEYLKPRHLFGEQSVHSSCHDTPAALREMHAQCVLLPAAARHSVARDRPASAALSEREHCALDTLDGHLVGVAVRAAVDGVGGDLPGLGVALVRAERPRCLPPADRQSPSFGPSPTAPPFDDNTYMHTPPVTTATRVQAPNQNRVPGLAVAISQALPRSGCQSSLMKPR